MQKPNRYQPSQDQALASKRLRGILGLSGEALVKVGKGLNPPAIFSRSTVRRAEGEEQGRIKSSSRRHLLRAFKKAFRDAKLHPSAREIAANALDCLLHEGIQEHLNSAHFREEVEPPFLVELTYLKDFPTLLRWHALLPQRPSPMGTLELRVRKALAPSMDEPRSDTAEIIDAGLRPDTKFQVTAEDLEAILECTEALRGWCRSYFDIFGDSNEIYAVGQCVHNLAQRRIRTSIGLLRVSETEHGLNSWEGPQWDDSVHWLLAVAFGVEPIHWFQVWFQDLEEERYLVGVP